MKKQRKTKVKPKEGGDVFHKNNLGVKIDLGCGKNKEAGWVGVDFRAEPGVDVVQNLTMFPWKAIPSDIASQVRASHLLEHINPDPSEPRLSGLIDLLLEKKVISKAEVDKHI